jgi:hypothetical protein
MLGGMIDPIVEEDAVTATENAFEYPDLTMVGIITAPIPAVSAVEDPDIPANNMLTRTFT